MQIAPTLKSASFRLAAAYAALFTISVVVLAAVIYFLVTGLADNGFRSRIRGEANTLHNEFETGGIQRLLRAITERQHDRLAGGLDYTLVDRSGKHLFGSVTVQSCSAGWVSFKGPPDGDEPPGQLEELRVLKTPLPGGYCLMIGDDAGKIRVFGKLILRSFGWGLLLSLTFAVLGGVFLSSNFLKRVEAMNRTAEAIIEGDMKRRIPRRAVSDDLDRLAATFNRMLDRITTLMDSLRHISNDVAHDLRTPLGRLRHFLEDAGRTAGTPEEYQLAIDKALSEVDGILDTFGAILRIAQIESGTRRAGFRSLRLSDLVQDICDSYEPSFEDAGKMLVRQIDPSIPICGDRELLVQSAANLLENALTHTPAGAKVVVELHLKGDFIELTVSDNGNGVPEGERARIFERFYRVEGSRTVAGNGLGLSIVEGVAELHSGWVTALDNNPGLRVAIRLPAAA
ncbi:MAG: HAMP domain-containing histidine kinase [Proteobacteria bacterium]|nr:HAMP domain-containing histidine kinase [Pseudomonadota bacterium]